jgi:ABC-type multidrug transport system fused ATPase/permease subunit
VLLDDLDLSHINRQVVSQHIGYLQQDHRLFQGSLRENLLIGLPDPGDEALLQAMKRTGMDKLVSSHPKGLERAIAEGGKGLRAAVKNNCWPSPGWCCVTRRCGCSTSLPPAWTMSKSGVA